jgi:nucleotide-binding universal stress UspA family protein
MIRSILVPLDGSEFSEQALPLAVELAQRLNAALHMVKVHTLVIAGDNLVHYTALDLEPASEIANYLERISGKVQSQLKSRPVTRVLEGAVSEALELYANETRCDLIVMTTHGRGGLSRAWLGSVADELIRHVSAPVLLLRPSEDSGKRPAPAALHRILIALKGTALSESILEPALEMARAFNAPVTLVRCIMPPRVYGLEIAGYGPAAADLAAAEMKERGITATPLLLEAPHAATAILNAARKENCDLIAIATHGRGGIPRLVLGSVTDKVVRGATSAVLVRRAAAK